MVNATLDGRSQYSYSSLLDEYWEIGIFLIPLGVSLHFYPKKALLILENLLIGYDLLRENFGEEGEMDKIPKLEVSCLNP